MGHTLTTRPSLTKLQSLNEIMKVSKFNREGAQGEKHVEKTKVMSSSELKHKTLIYVYLYLNVHSLHYNKHL